MKTASVTFLLLFVFMSYDKVNRLSEKDYAWMPYEENQVLVFNSNLGGIDTIFLLKKDTLYGYPEAQKFNGIITEHVTISSMQTDSVKNRFVYLESLFFSVLKDKNNKTLLDIRLNTKDSWFYGKGQFIDIEGLVLKDFSTAYRQYDDVIVFTGDNYYLERNKFVTDVYWSKSQGLIRYDKKNGEYWEKVYEE